MQCTVRKNFRFKTMQIDNKVQNKKLNQFNGKIKSNNLKSVWVPKGIG